MSESKSIILNASDRQHLLELLGEINIKVSPRTEGRTNEQKEIWSICYLMATLSSKEIVSYPYSLKKSERPDFILTLNQNNVGVEVTESIPPAYAECLTIRDKEKPDALIDISHFKIGSPRRSKEELRKLICSSVMNGQGWEGDSAESEWAKWILDAIKRKLRKLRNYQQLPDHWLLIYDNLHLPPGLNDDKAIEYLTELLRECCDVSKFSRIFVERSSIIIEVITRNFTTRQHDIVELWT